MAQKEKVIEINPFDNEHLERIAKLDSIISPDLLTKLAEITTIGEVKYKNNRRKSNKIDELFILDENGETKGLFAINGEKDIRSCLITIYYTNHCQPKKIISIGTEYALRRMNMQEVFVKVLNTDSSTRKYLEDIGYEYLGEEDGEITYLKDQISVEINQSNRIFGWFDKGE